MQVDHLMIHLTQTETGLVKCFLLKTEKQLQQLKG